MTSADVLGDDAITVVLCVDDNYIAQACVAVGSMLAASRSRFHVMVGAIDRDVALWSRHLDALRRRYAASTIEIVDLDASSFAGLATTSAVTLGTYARFLLADIVDATCKRVIFLDADTLVLADLAEVWALPLEGAVLAAAPDPFNINGDAIGFAPGDFYFNAGLLLVDLAAWRRDAIGSRALRYMSDHSDLPWLDQDALNAVLRGKVKPLDLAWNYQPRCADVSASFLSLTGSAYRRMRRAPKLIHFTTSHKPWNQSYRVHYSDVYLAAAASFLPDGGFLPGVPSHLGERLLAVKTWLRWRFPATFRRLRAVARPRASSAAYSAGPDARKTVPKSHDGAAVLRELC